jgi:hypothetical protein
MGFIKGTVKVVKVTAKAFDKSAELAANRHGKIVWTTKETAPDGRCFCGRTLRKGTQTCSKPACVKKAAANY